MIFDGVRPSGHWIANFSFVSSIDFFTFVTEARQGVNFYNLELNHRFYQKPKEEQVKIQILIALGAIFIIAMAFLLSVISGFFLLVLFVFPITLSIIAPFFDTPSLKKSGRLIYFSSLFIVEKEKNGVIKVHGGTLFDYVFVIDRNMSGKQRTSFIIQQYLEGLINLLEEYENNESQNIRVKGTTYIINKRTAHKIGFQVVKTDFIQNIILVYNYFNLLFSNSIARARLSFPNISNVITIEGNLGDLIANKERLISLNERIKKSLGHSR
ncbi:MAG: hypothetical protein ABR597_00945 [Bacteroidales bacterium]